MGISILSQSKSQLKSLERYFTRQVVSIYLMIEDYTYKSTKRVAPKINYY